MTCPSWATNVLMLLMLTVPVRSITAVGFTLFTVTVAVSVDELPNESVTRTPTVKTPLSPTIVNVGVWLVESSNWPSLSRSHSYVSVSPASGSDEPAAVSPTLVPSSVTYGPPASATGAWFGPNATLIDEAQVVDCTHIRKFVFVVS